MRTPILIRKSVKEFNSENNRTSKQTLTEKLELERKKIRAQLVVGSYVDNWPYVEGLPEKSRGRLLHKLRLIDEALLRLNKNKRSNIKKLKKE